MNNQSQIRTNIRQQRESLSHEEQLHLSHQIFEHIFCSDMFQKANSMAFYMAHRGEVKTQSLIDKCLNLNKKCYLPNLHPTKRQQLLFMPYHADAIMQQNKYRIEEVALDDEKVLMPWLLDCVFMPLVAFDDAKHRIGMGAGFYDRTFCFKKNNPSAKPILVGLAYEFQRVSKIDNQIWDIPVDLIVTEKGIR